MVALFLLVPALLIPAMLLLARFERSLDAGAPAPAAIPAAAAAALERVADRDAPGRGPTLREQDVRP